MPYQEHQSFEKPNDENAVIWRYMDFTKFVSLLEKQALFFVRGELLDDPLEGRYPRINQEMIRYMLRDVPQINRIQEHTEETGRRYIGVSCWNMNSHESAAMWKSYTKGDEGIAVQSTFKHLTESFRNAPMSVFAGTVRYLEPGEGLPEEKIIRMNMFDPFMNKRISFDYERELRAATMLPVIPPDYETVREFMAEDGMYVPSDCNILIKKVLGLTQTVSG